MKQLTQDIRQKTRSIASRITLKRKFVWAVRDGKKFDLLIADLRRHNDALHLLGPEWAAELLQVLLALEYLPRHNTPEPELAETGQSAVGNEQGVENGNTQASNQDNDQVDSGNAKEGTSTLFSPSQQGVQLLSDLMKIKAGVARNSETKELGPDEEKRLLSFRERDFLFGGDGMAVWLRGRETVFVERHSYCPPGGINGEEDRDLAVQIWTSILKLGRFLQLPACQRHLNALEVLGLVDLENDVEIGFVYRLPQSLGRHSKGFPFEDMGIRKPRAMFGPHDSLAGGEPAITRPSVGWRFDQARKLVQSVSFLHASGWLHKNISTTDMFLFPKLEVVPREGRTRYTATMDGDHFLLGYRFSRQDVISDDSSDDSDDTQQAGNDEQGRVTDDGTRAGVLPDLAPDGRMPPSPPPKPLKLHGRAIQSVTNEMAPDLGTNREGGPDNHKQSSNVSETQDRQQHKQEQEESEEDGSEGSEDDDDADDEDEDDDDEDDSEEESSNEEEDDDAESNVGTGGGPSLVGEPPAVPQDEAQQQPRMISTTAKSTGHRIQLGVRHHPSKRSQPKTRYCHAFDVYSLGIALLEMGFWQNIEALLQGQPHIGDEYNYMEPFELRRRIVSIVHDFMPFQCGDTYTNVVVACLMVDPEYDEEGLAEQRELCAKVAAGLAECRA